MLCLFRFCEAISCLGFIRGRRREEGKLSRSKGRHCGGSVSSCAKRKQFHMSCQCPTMILQCECFVLCGVDVEMQYSVVVGCREEEHKPKWPVLRTQGKTSNKRLKTLESRKSFWNVVYVVRAIEWFRNQRLNLASNKSLQHMGFK
ncbi:unnamed protein product [Malus baccata var. baccata]